jgi:membrane protease YdiL (CAAX protease family)
MRVAARPGRGRSTAAAARALAPIALLAAGAVFRPLRPVVLVVVVAGTALRSAKDPRVRWTWAGAIPAALSLCWGLLAPPLTSSGGLACGDPGSPAAIWRLGEAALVLASVAALAASLGATRGSLALRVPSGRVAVVALAGFVICGPLAIALGPQLARPFFGDVSFVVTPAGLVPALVFGLSNAATEEVAYRGALQGWSARRVGPDVALGSQAVVFGLAHSGPDVMAGAVPLALAMMAGGLVAGAIVRRTGSLAIPFAAHAALDLPLYLYAACSA